MSRTSELYIGCDNVIRYRGATNALTGNYLNDATVTFTILDENGTAVVSTVSMPYVAASNGNYEGVFESTDAANLVENAVYEVVVDFAQVDIVDQRRWFAVAQYRNQEEE